MARHLQANPKQEPEDIHNQRTTPLMFRRKKFTAQDIMRAYDLGAEYGKAHENLRIAVGIAALAPAGDYFEAPKKDVEAVLFPAEIEEKP